MRDLKLIGGNSNPGLVKDVAKALNVEPVKVDVATFSDGEISIEIQENVRGMDCFVLQSTSSPANHHLMEMLILVDALRRSSAKRVTTVIPYYGYARQDRKVRPRVPITARMVADLISVVGTDRVLCVDLHAGQIQGFFNIPVDNLFAMPVLLDPIRSRAAGDLTIISPDAGGVERARAYAKRLDAKLAIIDKRREEANVAEVMHIIGDVTDQVCVIVDDMVDTAGTLTQGAKALAEAGAREIYAAIAHPVLSGPAIERIEDSPLKELVVTDTIALQPDALACKKVRVASVANLLAESIRRINNEESVSSLFI